MKKSEVQLDGDPELVFKEVAKIVRGSTSAQLKRDANILKGSKDLFQGWLYLLKTPLVMMLFKAYHTGLCMTSELDRIVDKVVSIILSSSPHNMLTDSGTD